MAANSPAEAGGAGRRLSRGRGALDAPGASGGAKEAAQPRGEIHLNPACIFRAAVLRGSTEGWAFFRPEPPR